MGVNREKAKLGLLASLLVLALGSLLTSHKSFQMGPRDLPQLAPQVPRFCASIQKAKDKCIKNQSNSNSNNNNCKDLIQQASQTCPMAVKEAYRHVNMGGCPYELRDVTLCELERCGGYHFSNNAHDPFSQEGCVLHCDPVRKSLENCIRNIVNNYFRKYSLPIPQQESGGISIGSNNKNNNKLKNKRWRR